MKAQIALARLLREGEPTADLKDRLAFLKANHELNTPALAAELIAVKAVLRRRSKRTTRHT